MLAKFIESTTHMTSSATGAEAMPNITQSFDASIDYLRDPQMFDDYRTNIVTHSAWRLIGNRLVDVTLMPDQNFETPSFVIMDNEQFRRGIVVLPNNYHQMVEEDPLLQLGATAFISEKVRLYMQGHMRTPIDPTADKRSLAAEAGAALQIAAQAAIEKVNADIPAVHSDLIAQFPHGLSSLHEVNSSGLVRASRSEHIAPKENLTPEGLACIGEIDYVALASGSNAEILPLVFEAIKRGQTTLSDLEYYLRQVSSSLFLHATPAEYYSNELKPKNPLTGEPTEFGLALTRSGPDGRTPPTDFLDEIGDVYEENVCKLGNTGIFTFDI